MTKQQWDGRKATITIEDILREYERAWNAGDATAWSRCFAHDVEFIDVIGRVLHDSAAVAAEQQKVFDTVFGNSTLTVRLEARRELGAYTLLHVATTAHAPRDPHGEVLRGVQTLIVHNGLIELFHNTLRTSMATELANDPDLAALKSQDWTASVVVSLGAAGARKLSFYAFG